MEKILKVKYSMSACVCVSVCLWFCVSMSVCVCLCVCNVGCINLTHCVWDLCDYIEQRGYASYVGLDSHRKKYISFHSFLRNLYTTKANGTKGLLAFIWKFLKVFTDILLYRLMLVYPEHSRRFFFFLQTKKTESLMDFF